jgi:aryl-alcohol dehydrogenase-like predicted oxidoreductase
MQQTRLGTSQLGRTGLEITRVGFGAWAIGGGDWEFGWGAQDDAESVAAIERALELGVNWIDTAAVYGLGHSETIVRRALEGVDERPYVFSKAGLLDGGGGRVVNSLKRDSIRREVEASLTRLSASRTSTSISCDARRRSRRWRRCSRRTRSSSAWSRRRSSRSRSERASA